MMDFLQRAFLLNALEIHLISPRKGCRAVTVQACGGFPAGLEEGLPLEGGCVRVLEGHNVD